VDHARIRSWNKPVLSNEDKVSCSIKHTEAFDGGSNSTPTGIHQLQDRQANHCAMPAPLEILPKN